MLILENSLLILVQFRLLNFFFWHLHVCALHVNHTCILVRFIPHNKIFRFLLFIFQRAIKLDCVHFFLFEKTKFSLNILTFLFCFLVPLSLAEHSQSKWVRKLWCCKHTRCFVQLKDRQYNVVIKFQHNVEFQVTYL